MRIRIRNWLSPSLLCVSTLGIGSTLMWLVSDRACAQQDTGLERLLALNLSSTQISFVVRSAGCTSRNDFGLVTSSRDPLTISLVRIRPDHCRARVPTGRILTFRFAELGASSHLTGAALRQVVILNPLDTPPHITDDQDEERWFQRQKSNHSKPSWARN